MACLRNIQQLDVAGMVGWGVVREDAAEVGKSPEHKTFVYHREEFRVLSSM